MKYLVWVGMMDTAGKKFGSRIWMHEQYSCSVQSFGLGKGYQIKQVTVTAIDSAAIVAKRTEFTA